MNIDEKLQEIKNALKSIGTEDYSDVEVALMTKADADSQMAKFPHYLSSMFPDLMAVVFKRDASNEELIEGLDKVREQISNRIDNDELTKVRANLNKEFSLKLGI